MHLAALVLGGSQWQALRGYRLIVHQYKIQHKHSISQHKEAQIAVGNKYVALSS